MKKILTIKIIILSMILPNLTIGKNNTSEYAKIIKKIQKLNPKLKNDEYQIISRAIVNSSRKYNIKPEVFLSIIKVESNFNQKAVSSTGDISIAQINYNVWSKEFKRLKLKPINKVLLKNSITYSVDIMGKILSIIKQNNKLDKNWYSRYHSNTKKYRQIYANKLYEHKLLIASNPINLRH